MEILIYGLFLTMMTLAILAGAIIQKFPRKQIQTTEKVSFEIETKEPEKNFNNINLKKKMEVKNKYPSKKPVTKLDQAKKGGSLPWDRGN